GRGGGRCDHDRCQGSIDEIDDEADRQLPKDCAQLLFSDSDRDLVGQHHARTLGAPENRAGHVATARKDRRGGSASYLTHVSQRSRLSGPGCDARRAERWLDAALTSAPKEYG